MIPNIVPVNNWTGNSSTTTFDFDFLIEKASELQVLHTASDGTQTTLTNNVDYSIHQIGNADGSYITFPISGSTYSVLSNSEKISLILNLPCEQSSPYGTSTKLDLKAIEHSFDYLTRLVQIYLRRLERAVKVPEGSDVNTDQLAVNLTKVADIASQVTVVANNVANVITVADSISDVNTVATNISDVNAVGGSISNVNAVALDLTNIDAVAGDLTNIDIVAGIADDVSAVASVATDIPTVADDLTNIDTVATNISDVNAVGGSISNVNAVAGDLTNIDAVNSNKTNIDTVAGAISNVNAVGGSISNVNAVANDLTNINAIASDLTNIDNASTYATSAKQYAVGLPSEPTEGSSKYWANRAASVIPSQTGNSGKFLMTNGSSTSWEGVQQQLFVMPEATASLLGSIVQYMGTDTVDYTHGVMYQCVPVYGSFTVTTVDMNNVTLDEEVFKSTDLYDASTTSYTFECTRGGLRQTWLLPDGRSWLGNLLTYGISYTGRPTIGATITLSRSIVGYTWEPYAGVSSGNDKIKVVGDKIYGINVVGQYNALTMPDPSAELAGTIVQFTGQSSLLSGYREGHFYRCEQNRRMRDYTLEADPMKYSLLRILDFVTLDDFMQSYDNPVTFVWQGDGRGWVEEDSMSMLGTDDLTQYGITYTLNSGETLETGDKITINFIESYYWAEITVQDGIEVVSALPEASHDYYKKIVLYNGVVLNSVLPYPESLNVNGKLYQCVRTYNEQTYEYEYEWKPLPYQFGLLQYTELPSDVSQVYTNQCIQYVGASKLWKKYAEYVYLENGHIYRATIVDEDDPDFAAVRYVDVHPYQMVYMPDPIAAYNGVITQYVGTGNGTYTNGHFYQCVATGNMTDSSAKQKHDGSWSVSIDPSVLETQVSDPTEPMKFEFHSQTEGAQWMKRVDQNTWTSVDIADYGITITGEVPYGSLLYVKYIEPQDEYEWQEVSTGSGSGSQPSYDSTNERITWL